MNDKSENPVTFKYRENTVNLVKGKYYNGRIKLSLVDTEGVITNIATVNMVDKRRIGKNQVIIKTYGVNSGLLECLQKNKIVGKTLKQFSSGLHLVHLVDLLI